VRRRSGIFGGAFHLFTKEALTPQKNDDSENGSEETVLEGA
jgi:hypothetical protein